MPLVNLAAYTFAIQLILVARFDEQLRTVARAAEMALQIFPPTVGFERTVYMGTAVRTESLLLFVGKLRVSEKSTNASKEDTGKRRKRLRLT